MANPPKKKYVSKTQGTRLDDGTYVTPIAEVKGYKTPANAVREGRGKFAKALFSGTNLASEVMGAPLAVALETLSGRNDYKSALPNLDRSNKMFGLAYDKNNLPQNEQLSPSTALGITNPFISVPIDLAADLVTGKLATSGKNIGKNLLKNKIPNQINSYNANNLLNVSGLFDVNQNQLQSNPTNLSPIDDLHISHKNDMYSFFYNVDEKTKNKINTIYNDNYNALENINDKIERQKLAAYLTTRDNKLKNNSVFNVEDIKEKSMSELTNDEIAQLREKIGFNPPSVELLNKFDNNPKEKIKDLIPLAKPLEEAKYTPEELLAGRRYTRGFDQQLNLVNRLRGGSNEFFWGQKDKLLVNPKPIKKAIFEDANILQNAILKQKFAEDMNLYRNIQGNVHVIDAQGNKVVRPSVYAMNVGDIIEEKGFMSTSINPESFGSTGKLSINAPAKKQSFYQPNQNLNSSEFITEHEALLPKGIKLQYTGNKDIKGNPIMNIMNPYMKTGIVATAGLLGNQMLQSKPKSKYGSKILKYIGGGEVNPPKINQNILNNYIKEKNKYLLEHVFNPTKPMQKSDVENNAQEFLTKMINSPLFEKRYNTMRNKTATPEEIKTMKNSMLDHMEKVQYWPTGYENIKKLWEPDNDAIAHYIKDFEVEKDNYGIPHLSKDLRERWKGYHTIFRKDNSPTATLHELSHASTNSDSIPASINIPYSKISEKKEHVEKFSGPNYERRTEHKAYLDELRKYLYDKNIYDATQKEFDETDYNNLINEFENLKKEIKNNPNNIELQYLENAFEKNILPYDKENTIRLFNSYVNNNNKKDLLKIKYG